MDRLALSHSLYNQVLGLFQHTVTDIPARRESRSIPDYFTLTVKSQHKIIPGRRVESETILASWLQDVLSYVLLEAFLVFGRHEAIQESFQIGNL